MTSFIRALRTPFTVLFLCTVLLTLAACGGTGSNTGSKGTLTIGSKLDNESQLIAKMYTLLLQKAGYKVNEKAALGNSAIIFQAISSGAIDLYPEFTATGLNKLNIPSTYDPQKDYQNVKNGFQSKYNLTWLDPSPLNDGYAICTSKSESQKLGITTISQLAPQVSKLVLTSPSDGIAFIDGLQHTYGFSTKSFKQAKTVDYALGFQAVSSDQSQMTVCYGTDATVPQQNFIFLKDDKNGFPAFNPAPVVRSSVLNKYSDIAPTLNKLAPYLTTDVSIQLQENVAQIHNGGASTAQAVTEVATNFLKSKGLL
ncbi:MAG TPA: glycine betaine ABC transporter substrate-binding protein [Ktedonobacteraceae bacterium]